MNNIGEIQFQSWFVRTFIFMCDYCVKHFLFIFHFKLMSDKKLWLWGVWGPSIFQYVVNTSSRSVGEIKMIPSLKPEIMRIAIAGLVIVISTLIYVIAPIWNGPFQYSEIISWQLICILQIIGGIFLFIGSLIVSLGLLKKLPIFCFSVSFLIIG